MHNKALSTRINALGPDHAMVASSQYNAADVLSKLKRYDEALEMHTKSLSTRLKCYGPNHSHIGMSQSKIGSCLGKMGQFESALKMNYKALETFENVHGPKHPRVDTVVTNIVNLLCVMGKRRQVEDFTRSRGRLDVVLAVSERQKVQHPIPSGEVLTEMMQQAIDEIERLMDLLQNADQRQCVTEVYCVHPDSHLIPDPNP